MKKNKRGRPKLKNPKKRVGFRLPIQLIQFLKSKQNQSKYVEELITKDKEGK